MSTHIRLDIREIELQQTFKGTAEAKDILWPTVPRLCLNEISPLEDAYWRMPRGGREMEQDNLRKRS